MSDPPSTSFVVLTKCSPIAHKNMENLTNFERSNARQWDEESAASVPSSSRYRGPPVSQQHGDGRLRLSTNANPAPVRYNETRVTPVGQQSKNSAMGNSSSSTSRGQLAQANEILNGGSLDHYPQSQQRETHKYTLSTERRPPTTRHRIRDIQAKEKWARPAGLVTVRKEIRNVTLSSKEEELKKYRTRPDADEEFPATGYYLWPKGYGDPMSLLDPKLERLDSLRLSYRVHIDWDDKLQCLRINSQSGPHSAHNIAGAIKGIRQAYRDAKAQIISASPLYIIVPPTTSGMRSIVKPKTLQHRSDHYNKVVTSIELAGQPLSEEERSNWKSIRPKMVQENFDLFRTHLINRTLPLADLRGWMRMRVHLGHVNLREYQVDFSDSKYSFDLFAQMMKKTRVSTAGTFDRKMDAAIAMKIIQKIVDRPADFCPRQSQLPTLRDVLLEPKHTEIVFVTTAGSGGQDLRIEADIDCAFASDKGKYQIGTTKLFHNDKRNKRFEVTTVDIESKFDWTLEIITDGSIPAIPVSLLSLMQGSLTGKSTDRIDSLGLPYPGVAPRIPSDFTVKSVVVRSVFQYSWAMTQNIVEISIYRLWEGCNTKPEPILQTSVSMFHPDWDSEMESIENTTLERNWDRQLNNFFGDGGMGRDVAKNTGLVGLMDEIQVIQGFLSDAAGDSTSLQESPSL